MPRRILDGLVRRADPSTMQHSSFGRVEIPQEAFIAALKMDAD